MEKIKINPQANRVRNAPKRETMERAEAMREYREILKRIELHKTFDDEWNSLWDRKRQLRAILNPHN